MTTEMRVKPAPFAIKFKPLTPMDDEQFAEFCALNDDIRIERDSKGEIILLKPIWERPPILRRN